MWIRVGIISLNNRIGITIIGKDVFSHQKAQKAQKNIS